MRKYFADTNFYLRFLLQDNKEQASLVEIDLKRAKAGQKLIVFLSPVILEMVFVLKSFYSISISEIAKNLLTLIKTPYIEIEDRDLWLKILPTFAKRKIGLLDLFILEKARNENGGILTFDRNLKKLMSGSSHPIKDS